MTIKQTFLGFVSLVAMTSLVAIAPSVFMAVWFDTWFWLKTAASCAAATVESLIIVHMGDKIL